MMSVASIGLCHELRKSMKTLKSCLERSVPRHRPVIRLQTTSDWRPIPNLTVFVSTQSFKFAHNGPGVTSKLCWAGSREKNSTFCTRAFGNAEKPNIPFDGAQSKEGKRDSGSFVAVFFEKLIKTLAALLLAALLVAASLPTLFSWSPFRKAAISIANKAIPGTVSVASISLGWTQPVHLEGFVLQGIDNENVVSIPKIETKAPLWSIVLGKSGFGDCTITCPVIDLQQHPINNLPRISLALTSAEKILEKTGAKRPKMNSVPPANVTLSVEAKAPGGSLEVANGKIIFPSDVAAVLGDRLVVNVNLGLWATKENDELRLAEDRNKGVPLLASLWSDTVQFQAIGFLQTRNNKIKLLKPLIAEMDLTPKVAKFYLARINPLLGEIVGPAIQDDDMPDVVVHVTPTNLELPSDQYKINIAPMKVTLARGQVVDGILSLLSKQDLVKGRQNITMQTSALEARLDMPSKLESLRLDILIADKVHVATWGSLDWIDEQVKMTLAIPGKTLKDLLGLTTVSPKYYLKIGIAGTLEKPKVDWKAAGVDIAELTARQQGGKFMQSLLDTFYSKDKSKSDVPESIDILPWEVKSTH